MVFKMKIIPTDIEGAYVLEPDCHYDSRGFFSEIYQAGFLEEIGIKENFLQDNHSHSYKNVLRGLHFNIKKPQAQLLTVIQGEIFDVVVDLRRNSPNFGKWTSKILSDKGPRQMFMSKGLAHGFCVLSETADLHYKVTEMYDADDQGGLLWSDTDLNIEWPIANAIISSKDQTFPSLSSLIESNII